MTTVKKWLKRLLTGDPRSSWLYYRPQDELRTLAKFLLGRRPLYHHEDLEQQPFFIITAGRSGSTLLRAILCQHEDVSIPPEFWTLGEMIREYKRYSFLPWPWLLKVMLYHWEKQANVELWDVDGGEIFDDLRGTPADRQTLYTVVSALYDRYRRQHFPKASVWGDKTPLHTYNLHWVQQLFPEARYIHLVRDGRDVVSSLLKHDMQDSFEAAAARWTEAIHRARSLRSRIEADRFHRVRYESLVRDPEETVTEICEFLNLSYRPAMLQQWKLSDKLESLQRYDYHQNVSEAISTESIGKWQQRVPEDEHPRLHDLLRPELEEEGYLP